jgi:hypothetical protein
MSTKPPVTQRTSKARPSLSTALYATPPTLDHPLRVLLVAPPRVPMWVSRFLQITADLRWLAVSVLPVHGGTLPARAAPKADLRAFLALDRLRRRGRNATLRPVALRARDCLSVAAPVTPDTTLSELAVRVREQQPALVIAIAPDEWGATLADCAPMGCWQVDASLLDADWAGLSLLRPLAEDRPTTDIALELEGAALAPWGRARSVIATRTGSFGLQRDSAFLRLPLLLVRMLHRLAADEFVPPNRVARLRAPKRKPLDLDTGARALASTVATAARWQLQKGRAVVPWHLVLHRHGVPIDPAAPRVQPDITVQSLRANYWADPCIVDANGRTLLFVEEMWPDHKGVIAVVDLDGNRAVRLGTALDETVHVSYPQVFRADDAWYMTVESSQAKRVSLYRATSFPLEWERVCDLVSGRVCADPTLHRHRDGRWYLFTTVSENGNGTWDELFLFLADRLTGPYVPHPANPVVSDVRRARPGGRLFERNGKLIRPAQDCAANYGSALAFNEVLSLSPTHYDERPLSRLAPDWAPGLVACHTYSASATHEVFDARGIPAPGSPRAVVIEPEPDRSAVEAASSTAPVAIADVPVAPSLQALSDHPERTTPRQ